MGDLCNLLKLLGLAGWHVTCLRFVGFGRRRVSAMNKAYAFLAGSMALMLASPASADVIYDTLHQGGLLSATGIPNLGPLAISFDVPTATTITDVQLLMNAITPGDGGTVMVYLVPDDGTGGGTGKAGSPSGGTAFNGKSLIGTIADSQLVAATTNGPGQQASVINLPESLSVAAGEYWLGFTEDSGGSAKLVFDLNYTPGPGNSIGTAFQNDFSNQGGSLENYPVNTVFAPPIVATGGARAFEALISTPEPTSLTLMGVGLASLGFFRRRRCR